MRGCGGGITPSVLPDQAAVPEGKNEAGDPGAVRRYSPSFVDLLDLIEIYLDLHFSA